MSDVFGQNVKQKLGGRFRNIGLGNVAVVAARVVELPPRCSNKGVNKTSMSIKRLRESFCVSPPGREVRNR